MEKSIFETKLTKVDYLISILLFGLIAFCLINFDFYNYNYFEIFLIVCGFISILYRIMSVKIYILHIDRLIIRRPFLFSKIFDIVFNINDIRKITIKHTGRFRGGSFRVNLDFFSRVNMKNKDYRFDNGIIQLKDFIENLRLLGIKIKDDI